MDRQTHWEAIYHQRAPTELSWYQAEPGLSLELIAATKLSKTARIIDVGGGASVLVDRLLDLGFTNLTVLDISEEALRKTRERLGKRAGSVAWLEADITQAELPHPFDLWHDRAVFHFLTDPADRQRYLERLAHNLLPGGHAILATFSLSGPPTCSGLEVCRYSTDTLARELGDRFRLVETREETHFTPRHVRQAFLYARFMKKT